MWGTDEHLRSGLTGRAKLTIATMAIGLMAAVAITAHEHAKPSTEQIMQSVVAIGDADGLHGAGAVLKGGRYIITVNHVIEDMVSSGKGIVVRYHDGTTTDAAVVKRNRIFDIALLEVEDSHAGGMGLSDNTKQGDHVRTIGHPFGIPWMISDGLVSRKSYYPPGINGNMFVIWTTAWIEGGNSGGPLVNDSGEIVGLVMAFVNPRGLQFGAQHINLCVSGSEILRFMESP